MKFASDVDALAAGKCSIEVSGILEFELETTHFLLPSSALSESGSRGRSLTDPLSHELPRRSYVLNAKRTTATATAGNIRIIEFEGLKVFVYNASLLYMDRAQVDLYERVQGADVNLDNTK